LASARGPPNHRRECGEDGPPGLISHLSCHHREAGIR
jgi:hypothetical protein